MGKRILYQQSNGVVAIIVPALNCGLTVEQIAEKDVPTGEPYWIVEDTDIPADRTERDKWILDTDEAGSPDGYGG